MARGKKASKERTRRGNKGLPPDGTDHNEHEESELPSDETGRLKVKKNYEELLGIRIEKLKGHVLNREKINKTIEGVYFVCAVCRKVCHSLDEGLVQEPQKQICFCGSCAKERGIKEQRGLAS